MAFDSWMYGDPEKVLMRKQEIEAAKARACGNFTHRRSMEFKGEVGNFCEFKRHTYGKRCDLYEVKQK